jgi:hypothetical protein
MRSEEEVRDRLLAGREALADTTDRLSRGGLEGVDLAGVAGTVGIIRALEWVLGESGELPFQAEALHTPIEDI